MENKDCCEQCWRRSGATDLLRCRDKNCECHSKAPENRQRCAICNHERCPTCKACHNSDCENFSQPLRRCFDLLLPTTNTTEAPTDESAEHIAMNIVHQVGDALYEALPPDVAHEHFVKARQATNDIAIDFTKKLIASLLKAECEKAYDRGHCDGHDASRVLKDVLFAICKLYHEITCVDNSVAPEEKV